MYKVNFFSINDIFNIPLVNLDYKTENFNFTYYLYYFLNHSHDNIVIKQDTNIAYIIGKHEGVDTNFHSHVTALSIAPSHRRSGLGGLLMRLLEYNGNCRRAYFVDLFVRAGNEPAVKFYASVGYVVYRTVIRYYITPAEDAYDMRKALDADVDRKSVKVIKMPVYYNDEEETM